MPIEFGDVFPKGLLSARPAAGSTGRWYAATDTGLLYKDNGATWETWTPQGTAGPTGPTGATGPSPTVASAITSTVAIANTETVVVSYTCAANELAAGTTFLIRAVATRAGTTTASPIIRVRVGTTTLTGNIAASLTPPTNTLAVPNDIDGIVTVRSSGGSGTVIGSLRDIVHLAAVTISPSVGAITSAVSVDTTAASVLIELTFISGNAANTYTFQEATLVKVKA